MKLELLLLEKKSKCLHSLCNGNNINHIPQEDTVYRHVLVYLTQYGNLELSKAKAINLEEEGHIKKLNYMLKNVNNYFDAATKYFLLNVKCEEFFFGEKTKNGYFNNFDIYKSKEKEKLITYVEDSERLLKSRGLIDKNGKV